MLIAGYLLIQKSDNFRTGDFFEINWKAIIFIKLLWLINYAKKSRDDNPCLKITPKSLLFISFKAMDT